MKTRRARGVEYEAPPQVGGGWWMVHGLPLGAPGIGCLVWGLLVLGAHSVGGGDPVLTPFLAIVAVGVCGGITWFMANSAGERKDFRRVMTCTGAYGTATMTTGLIVGPAAWMAWTWAVLSLVVWAVWVIWRGSKYGGSTAQGDGSGANALLEMAKDAKVRISAPKIDDRGVVRAKVSTLPGGTIEDARALLGPISAETRAVQGGAALTRHPDVDGLGEIEIATRDNLKVPIPWPGLTRDLLGILPVDAFPIGEYQTGPCQVRIVGDHRRDRSAADISHAKIGGVTGAGKSTGGQVLLGSLMGMRRLNIVGVDISTELQILGPVADGLTWLITDEDEARQFLYRMNKVVVPGRKAVLAREGLKRWTLDSDLNLLLAWFEESKAFHKLSAPYHQLVSDARAAGVMVVSSTQSWLFRNVSTDVRKQHTSGWCFGMSEPDDVGTVLPEEAVAALGDNLPTWAHRKPGYSYLAGLGVPEHMWPKMMRTYDPLREQLVQAVEVGAPYRDPMDRATADLFSELYAGRRHRSRSAARVPAAPVFAAPPSKVDTDQEDDHEGEQEELDTMAAEEYEQDRDEVMGELEAGRLRDLGDHASPADLEDVDADQPIPQIALVDDEDDGDEPRVKMTPQQAQSVWDRKLDELWRSGVRQLKTGDLTEWLAEVDRERPFLYRQRDRWEELKCIEARPDADGWDLIGSPLEGRLSPPHGQ